MNRIRLPLCQMVALLVTCHAAAVAEGLELPADRLRSAADYSAAHRGASVLVMHDGKIVFERYESGCDAATAIHLHSATKGFWGPVIAAMIEDRLITSF